MIVTRPRIAELVFLHYARPVHPEFFRVVATKRIHRQGNLLTLWITSTGHVMTFQSMFQTVTEVVTASHLEMPPSPVSSFPIRGFQAESFDFPDLLLSSASQVESLSPKNFCAMQKEIRHSQETKGMIFRFASNGRLPFGAVSYLDLQTRRSQIQLRACHTFPEDYTVVRTDSVLRWPPAGE